jgi:hexosaminidase
VLAADQYPGLVRALESFSQAFYQGGLDLPLQIEDAPDLEVRGLMIDSSRHFLSVGAIKGLMDGMMYDKMNTLHWHIVDQDYFPMEVPALPNITKYDTWNNSFYSPAQLDDIVNYALRRGIRVIPEWDTPGHSQALGRSLQPDDFVITCGIYSGQFDVSMEKAYNWTQQIWNYIITKFPDPLVHGGGDEVYSGCWDSRPSIKKFMA